jgi:hypothetical protein
MKNSKLEQTVAEPEAGNLYPSLHEIPQDGEKLSKEGVCFLTEDVHWVKKSSGEGVCRHDE